MAALDDTIKRIQDKLQQVVKQATAWRKENEKLRHELQELKASTRQKDELIQILELRIDVLKASKGEMPEADKKELEKKINQYIREIDKCLALLND
ncbi:MAG: hypothetical protein INR73_23980 [Williamsia sp.]|nr:hypothetical protein [Williamsia sp.]